MSSLSGSLGAAELGIAGLGFGDSSSAISGAASFIGVGLFSATPTVISEGAGTFLGTGLFTATGAVLVQGSGSFLGTGLFSATGAVIISGAASFIGTGRLGQIVSCPPDALFKGTIWPRITPSIIMPTAYIILLKQPTEIPQCSPNTTTIPATQSSTALIETAPPPENNQ